MLIFPQDEHERLLIDQLAALGVTVERQTELARLRGDTSDDIARDAATRRRHRTNLRGAPTSPAATAPTPPSARRSAIDFPGGTYAHLFYVADVDATGAGDQRRAPRRPRRSRPPRRLPAARRPATPASSAPCATSSPTKPERPDLGRRQHARHRPPRRRRRRGELVLAPTTSTTASPTASARAACSSSATPPTSTAPSAARA